jgi:hypothetical protein
MDTEWLGPSESQKAPGKPSSVFAAIEDVLDQDEFTQQQKVENL